MEVNRKNTLAMVTQMQALRIRSYKSRPKTSRIGTKIYQSKILTWNWMQKNRFKSCKISLIRWLMRRESKSPDLKSFWSRTTRMVWVLKWLIYCHSISMMGSLCPLTNKRTVSHLGISSIKMKLLLKSLHLKYSILTMTKRSVKTICLNSWKCARANKGLSEIIRMGFCNLKKIKAPLKCYRWERRGMTSSLTFSLMITLR